MKIHTSFLLTFFVLFFHQTIIYSQNWKFIHGSKSPGSISIYSSSFTSTSVPSGRYASNYWSTKFFNYRSIFLFGGEGHLQNSRRGLLSDLWEMNVDINQWRIIHYSHSIDMNGTDIYQYDEMNYPENRRNGIHWYGVGHQGNKTSFIKMGGLRRYISGRDYRQNDIWEYSLKVKMWRKIKDSSPVDVPIKYGNGTYDDDETYPVVFMKSTVVQMYDDDDDDKILLFGGVTNWGENCPSGENSCEMNDLWEYSIILNQFRYVKGSQGFYKSGVNYDPFKLAIITGEFNESIIPPPRSSAIAWIYNDGMYLHGGVLKGGSLSGCFYSDMWIYNYTLNAWKVLSDDGIYTKAFSFQKFKYDKLNHPGSRIGHVGWKYEDHLLFLYGGRSFLGEANFNDVWVYSILRNSWKLVNGTENSIDEEGTFDEPFVYPPARTQSACLTFDRDVYIFGGFFVWEAHRNDLFQYLGYENETYDCFGIPINDDIQVCSGNGVCYGQNICECEIGYEGADCHVYKCGKFVFNHAKVCFEKGDCLSTDNCNCSKSENFYGKECKDQIESAEYDSNGDIIIDYKLPLSEVNSITTDCSKIIEEIDKFGMSSCIWTFGTEFTEYLKILPENKNPILPSGEEKLILKVFTNDQELIYLDVQPYKVYSGYIMYIIIGNGVCVSILFTAFFILIISLCCNYINKKKISKFQSIEDIDLLLSEQEALNKSTEKKKAVVKIDKNLFKVSVKDIELISQLSSSNTNACVVYKAKWNALEIVYKVYKIISFGSGKNEDGFNAIEKEISIISSVRHPHILSCFGCTCDLPSIGILLEFCSFGSLKNYFLQNNDNAIVEIDVKIRFLKEISSGLLYLHSQNIIYRDLKIKNILLNESLSCKISEFGASKLLGLASSGVEMTKRVGSKFYMAPELILSEKYGFEVDSFSFSILCFEILFQNFEPFGFDKDYSEFKIVNDSNYRPLIKDDQVKKFSIPPFCIDLMKRNWSSKPTDRMKFDEIVKYFEK